MNNEHEIGGSPFMAILPRRGRPPAEEPCTSLSVWIPTKYYDRLAQLANGHQVSMSALVRQMIVLQLRQKT